MFFIFQFGNCRTVGARHVKVRKLIHTYKYKHIFRITGFCSSSVILTKYRTKRFGNCICFRLQKRRGRHLLCWDP
jgi:hypothetical protein